MGCPGLKYFSENHLLVEQGHAVFEERAKNLLSEVVLDSAQRARAMAIVDACYDAIEAMFRDILAGVDRAAVAGSMARPSDRLAAARPQPTYATHPGTPAPAHRSRRRARLLRQK